jgi:Flp pilus assembly protein TadD
MGRARLWRFGILGVVICLALVGLLRPHSDLGGLLLMFVLFLAIIIPAHELGHALAGALVGLRIVLIRIGVGPRLASFRAWGVTVEINALPLGGATLGFPPRPRALPRVREWVFASGGLLANLALALLLRKMFGPVFGDDEHHPYASMASTANITVMIMNAIPMRFEGAMTDGYHLFTIPFWSPHRIARMHIAAEGRLAAEAAERGDVAGALARSDALAARHPGHESVAVVRGQVLHLARREEEARAAWREGLALTSDDQTKALLKNNVAWVDVLLGRPEDLPEADQFSAEALAALPEQPAIRGTRGSVLVRLGQFAEAIPHLERCLTLPSTPAGQASTTAFLACALASTGRRDEGRQALERARALDPTSEVLPLAEACVAGEPLPAGPPGAEGDAAQAASTAAARAAATAAARAASLVPAWRRDVRIVGFAVFLALPKLGLPFLLGLLVPIFLELAPEPGIVLALGAVCTWVAAVLGSRQIDLSDRLDPPLPGAAFIALAGAAALFWLYRRSRGIALPKPTRSPFVLSLVLTLALAATLLVNALSVMGKPSAMSLHEDLEAVVDSGMGLAALSALWLSSRRRWVRAAAAVPLALLLVGGVGASRWRFERFVVGDIPPNGAAIAFAEPRPAVVLRERTFETPGQRVTLSPGGKAYAVVGTAEGAQPGHPIDVGDFAGAGVRIEGIGGVFVDDERFLVTRRKTGRSELLLVQLRPLVRPEPDWSKDVPLLAINDLSYDAATQTVFVDGYDGKAQKRALATRADGDAPWVPLRSLDAKKDEYDVRPLATVFGPAGAAELVFGPRHAASAMLPWAGSGTGPLWLSGPERRTLLSVSFSALRCARPGTAAASVWCVPTGDILRPVLLRVDTSRAVLERVPERMGFVNDLAVLDPTHLALINYAELRVIDLAARRGERLTLPKDQSVWDRRLVDGALATCRREGDISAGGESSSRPMTITVYAPPTATAR